MVCAPHQNSDLLIRGSILPTCGTMENKTNCLCMRQAISAAAVGASYGLIVKLFANGLQKTRLLKSESRLFVNVVGLKEITDNSFNLICLDGLGVRQNIKYINYRRVSD